MWIGLEHALVCWSSYKGYLKRNVSEILQENLGNLIRGKKIHEDQKNAQEMFRTMSKSYLDIQKWKTNKKFVWEKSQCWTRQTCQSFVAI